MLCLCVFLGGGWEEVDGMGGGKSDVLFSLVNATRVFGPPRLSNRYTLQFLL